MKRECKAPAQKCGTNAGYAAAGRCRACVLAAQAANNHRRRMIAYGQWSPFVDAEPVRQHVNRLRAQGMGADRIAEVAGVSLTVVTRLLYRVASAEPTRQMRTANAAALMAVGLNLSPRAYVDATGTRRRVEALIVLGWSRNAVGAQLDTTRGLVSQWMSRRYVARSTADKVAALYDQLCLVAPIPRNGFERAAAQRARDEARRRGFASALAWDDDTIDDPDAQPDLGNPDADLVDEVAVAEAMAGHRAPLTRREQRIAIDRLTERGMGAKEIGERVQLTGRGVVRQRARAAA